MAAIGRLLGNRQNIDYISGAEAAGKLSHSFIISGERGSGKKTFAKYIARALLCTGRRAVSDGACENCAACTRTNAGSHPDLIMVTHEKETVLSVDEIRDQIVNDVSVRPFYGPYRIYIVPDAHLMNDHGQNALLKTIEEPPEYVLIFLLTENEEMLLETIRSRCIKLNMERLSVLLTAEALGGSAAMPAAAFSDGNLGRAKEIFENEDETEFIRSVEELMTGLKTADAVDISEFSSRIEKERAADTLETVKKWFVSVLLKKEGSGKNYFPHRNAQISSMARSMSHESINNILKACDEARERLSANVKSDGVFENLFLAIRRYEQEKTW